MNSAEGGMSEGRERWALILGASSGMGEATAIELARVGYRIVGIHMDMRSATAHVAEVTGAIEAAGSEALYINMNAADDEKRAGAIARIGARFEERRAAGAHPYLRIAMHSLAFGSLVPFIPEAGESGRPGVTRRQLEMTLDVMANSLVYWTQDLLAAGLLERGSRVLAMTSEGSTRALPSYGPVSAAKAALEAHVRQLAVELALQKTGITVNAIRAGTTLTPAIRKFPDWEQMVATMAERNPTGRITTTEDVAAVIRGIGEDAFDRVTGTVIGVDGGEMAGGFH